MPDTPLPDRFRLVDLTVDSATRQVWRDGVELPLPGLSFDLLVALARAGTRVVSTDELMGLVWPGRVVNAETVAKRVELVREALGDDSQEPRYLAGVRGHGYRLLHVPQAAPPVVSVESSTAASEAAPTSPPQPSQRRWPSLPLATGAAVLVTAVIAWWWIDRSGDARGAREAVSTPIPSVAVLPFTNLSEDAANVYFSDGISEELRGTLSKLPGVRIASRTSAFSFRNSQQPLPEIARVLNVDHIVEGSVRKAGNRIRVTAQLIDVRSDSNLWAETYDRELENVFAIQQEIAENIAGALKLRLTSTATRSVPSAQQLEAYQLYLRGLQLWQLRGEQNIRQSIGLLTRAVDLDPQLAQAHATLAAAYAVSTFYYQDPDPRAPELAEQSAARASQLDPTLSQPHAVRGVLAMQHLDWENVHAHHRRAMTLNANDASARYWLGESLLVAGRTREALTLMLEAAELDPISPPLIHDIAHAYLRDGDDLRGCPYAQRAVEIGETGYSLLELAGCYQRAGNIPELLRAEAEAERRLGLTDPVFGLVREAVLDPSKKPVALSAIAEAEVRHKVSMALAYRRLGEFDAAFDRIERPMFTIGDWNALRDLWGKDAREFRAQPRFRELIVRLKLLQHWRKSGWADVCRPKGETFECD
jgi:TolB-like protein/DNA-binding winged helix-turn-helix (wHTH) protein